MKVGSLFSGIGGFDRGIEMTGAEVIWQVEQDKDCLRVLTHHYPEARRYHDVKEVGKANLAPVGLICGGFPCQDLSVAGKRAGLDGERSGLWFEFARIIDELEPSWVLIENVPGLLSSGEGRDFAIILQWLAGRGYCLAWRVFDSQYFGVAQRRKRVFVVASFGNGGCAEVLFESTCGCGDTPPGREKGQEVAGTIGGGSTDSRRGYRADLDTQGAYITPTLRGGSPGGSTHGKPSGTDQGPFVVRNSGQGYWKEDDKAATIRKEAAGVHESTLVAYGGNRTSGPIDKATACNAKGGTGRSDFESETFVVGAHKMLVRRLTPTECLRLQGFPDDWLDLSPPLSDSAKYRMVGNAVTVDVIRWIGGRIMEIGRNG
jgi:DNA (cytosine-5)-methyltransferase 1